MLVTRQDIVKLKNLSTVSDIVPVDSIPDSFKTDFNLFFFGKTFLRKGSISYAYPHDIKKWVKFLIDKYQGE